MGTGLVMLREGFEISLIVVVCLAFLRRAGQPERSWAVWLGVLAALALAAGACAALLLLGRDLSGRAESVWEGTTMLAAALLVIWMVFWMRRHARQLRGQIEQGLERALGQGSLWGLALVAFVGVLREGLETALLVAGAVAGSRPLTQLVGGVVGAGGAGALGYLLYRGSDRLDLKRFFSLTALILLVFAAWLVARAVDEYGQLGWLPQATTLPIAAFLAVLAGLGLAWRRS